MGTSVLARRSCHQSGVQGSLDGKQVCLPYRRPFWLWHYKTRERFLNIQFAWGCLPVLSRQGVESAVDEPSWYLDIAIGTHRLIGKELFSLDYFTMKNIGLGLHKDRIAPESSDILAMTAFQEHCNVPGRDSRFSVIRTRQRATQCKTFPVCRTTDVLVRDAIRELARGGQVFFVHNRVHSIDAHLSWLSSMISEARIAVGHGQMTAENLSRSRSILPMGTTTSWLRQPSLNQASTFLQRIRCLSTMLISSVWLNCTNCAVAGQGLSEGFVI